MAAQTLIKETTDAVSDIASVEVTSGMVPATLFATNLAGAEEVQVLFSVDGGKTFQPVIQETTTVVLSATNNITSINSPMRIGVTKDATASASGVFLAYRSQV